MASEWKRDCVSIVLFPSDEAYKELTPLIHEWTTEGLLGTFFAVTPSMIVQKTDEPISISTEMQGLNDDGEYIPYTLNAFEELAQSEFKVVRIIGLHVLSPGHKVNEKQGKLYEEAMSYLVKSLPMVSAGMVEGQEGTRVLRINLVVSPTELKAEEFGAAFAMECEAIKRVRMEMGLTNVAVMVPFVRTLGQAAKVMDLLAKNGLKRGDNGLKVMMMCEVPSNAILADAFLEYFDGFSIGSNDLTQLTLGLDRDSGLELLAADFDERDPAVKAMLTLAISACKRQNKYVGICGQGPSDHPDFAQWLVDQGIESISLNPDSVIATWQALAK